MAPAGDAAALPQDRRARARLDRHLPQARRLPVDREGLQADDSGGGPEGAGGLRAARSRRRCLFDGQEGLLPAARRHGQVPLLQRGRVRTGRLQGPRADPEEPAPADRGDDHRRAGGRGQPLLHLYPRRVRPAGRHPRRGGGRGLRGRLPRPGRARHRGAGRAGRPPRRRCLHLRRGDRSARLPRGQTGQPAPEAALPRSAGPLRRTDADQQRRDAIQRAAHRRLGFRLVQELRHRAVAGHQGRLGLRRREEAGQLRGRARDPDQGADRGARGRHHWMAARSRASFPAAPRRRC